MLSANNNVPEMGGELEEVEETNSFEGSYVDRDRRGRRKIGEQNGSGISMVVAKK